MKVILSTSLHAQWEFSIPSSSLCSSLLDKIGGRNRGCYRTRIFKASMPTPMVLIFSCFCRRRAKFHLYYRIDLMVGGFVEFFGDANKKDFPHLLMDLSLVRD